MADRQNLTLGASAEFRHQLRHHASIAQWIVFSDLHVSASTLDTCLQVLQNVHAKALAQSQATGVVFLGDFWHQRGSLRVDCLNAILAQLAKWTVPLVMIPGNHDQVTLEGNVHALTALQNAFRLTTTDGHSIPGPLIFTQPTVFRHALWIPHIREHAVMQALLQSPHALQARAILCHVDVTGASMNDFLMSTGGIPPRWFPGNIPVYSGHFHKAHTVVHRDNRTIEYIGSPYQVSLSEAHQSKALVVMDQDWRIVQRLPLQVGRFHFRPDSLKKFLGLQPGLSRPNTEDSLRQTVCSGDRIVWSVDALEWENLQHDEQLQEHIRQLRQTGATVEIRQNPTKTPRALSSSKAREIEELSDTSTWQAYVEAEVAKGSLSEAKREMFYQKGLELVESVQKTQTPEQPGLGSHLEFHSVKIEGFGPFSNPVEYPLDKRGLVLVRGASQDDGSDSNGTGKSSLAMAPLWALTGALDPRPLPDGKVADVVHDGAKLARVTLQGSHNGNDFTVVQSKTNKKSGLTFLLDDKDLTTQSFRETQVVLDEVLGISQTILSRSVFFGQHPLNDLLEASDTRFKEELSQLVPLDTWHEVLAVARRLVRDCDKKIAELQGKIAIRQDDLVALVERTERANETYQEEAREFERLEESLRIELGELQQNVDPQNITKQIALIESAGDDLSVSIERLEKEREVYLDDKKRAESRLALEFNRSKASLDAASRDFVAKQRAMELCEMSYQNSLQSVAKLEAEWKVNVTNGGISTQLTLPSACPTCGQPLTGDSSKHTEGQVHQAFASAIENKISDERELETSRVAFHQAKAFNEERAKSMGHLDDTRTETMSWLNKQINKVEGEVRQAWQKKEQLTRDLAALTRKRQLWLEAQSVEQRLNAERETLLRRQEALQAAENEQRICQEMIESLESEQNEETEKLTLMKELSAAFSQRGIQVFVLRTALEALQTKSQSYLDILSDYTMELCLSLDDGERILRKVIAPSGEGGRVERSLASLSGGQWRRCSLALQLGFADLLSARGKFSSSLLVFDEPLTHLDQSGRSAFGRLLRRLLQDDRSTILLILQDLAAEELGEAFDCIDTVVKSEGRSSIELDETL